MSIAISKSTTTDLSNFTIVKHVTRPLLKLTDNTPYYVKFEEAMRQAEQIKNPKKGPDGQPVPPPTICAVLNLEDGIQYQMIANEVLKTELEKQYPDDAYVGKFFELIKNTKAEGKRYNTFGITELAPVEEEKSSTENTSNNEAEEVSSAKTGKHRR